MSLKHTPSSQTKEKKTHKTQQVHQPDYKPKTFRLVKSTYPH